MSSGPSIPSAPPASPNPTIESSTQPLTTTTSAPAAQSAAPSASSAAAAAAAPPSVSAPSTQTTQPDPASAAMPPAPSAQVPQPPTKDHIETAPQANNTPSQATTSTPAVPTPAPTPAPTAPSTVAPTAAAMPTTGSVVLTPVPSTTTATPSELKNAPLAPPPVDARPKTPILDVPANDQSTRPRSPSSSSVQHSVVAVDTAADLMPRTRSRRNSFSEGTDKVEKPSGLVLPQRPAMGKSISSSDLRSGLASPIIPNGALDMLIASIHADRPSSPSPLTIITFYAGSSHKPFEIHRHSLTSKSTYFKQMFVHGQEPTAEQTTYPDLDEYGFALFVRWLYGGELHGPKDFHSFQHYMSLYVLSKRFQIEALSNNVMDLCRAYYRLGNMTAPAYRIEYIYTFTKTPNHMRNFLITTAAYRALCEAPVGPGEHLSDSMKELIGKGGDVSLDFAEALIKLNKNGIVDVRRGSNCTFHEHSDGKYCQALGMEPYENA